PAADFVVGQLRAFHRLANILLVLPQADVGDTASLAGDLHFQRHITRWDHRWLGRVEGKDRRPGLGQTSPARGPLTGGDQGQQARLLEWSEEAIEGNNILQVRTDTEMDLELAVRRTIKMPFGSNDKPV